MVTWCHNSTIWCHNSSTMATINRKYTWLHFLLLHPSGYSVWGTENYFMSISLTPIKKKRNLFLFLNLTNWLDLFLNLAYISVMLLSYELHHVNLHVYFNILIGHVAWKRIVWSENQHVRICIILTITQIFMVQCYYFCGRRNEIDIFYSWFAGCVHLKSSRLDVVNDNYVCTAARYSYWYVVMHVFLSLIQHHAEQHMIH